ncbi:MAG: cytochrome c [Gemmatimonadota bacterium]
MRRLHRPKPFATPVTRGDRDAHILRIGRGMLVGVWLTTAASAQAQGGATDQPTPFAIHKAETLLREQLPCLGCHAFGREGGRLAPDLRTVRERRSADYIAAMIDAPQRTVPGSLMPRTVMLPATRDAIVLYLQSLPGDGRVPAAAAGGGAAVVGVADGAALYAAWCASCHGARGKGDGPNARYLPVTPAAHADASVMSRRADDALYDTIAGGGAIMNRSPRMPAFGATLTDAQLRALVAYLRVLCRCEGPAWSRP